MGLCPNHCSFSRLTNAAGDANQPVSHGVRLKQLAQRRDKTVADQAKMHISLLKHFLPDSFFKEDYDSIRLYLLLGRLSEKSGTSTLDLD